MRQILLMMALSLAAACTPVETAPPAPANPPAASSMSLDEKAIRFGFTTLDAVAAAADLLIATGKLKPGSPVALRVADGLETALSALNAASSFQRAGRAGSAMEAWTRAQAGIETVRQALDSAK